MPARKRTKKATKITVGVDPSVVRALDAEVKRLVKARPDREWSRSDLVRTALARHFGRRLSKKDRDFLYQELLRRAGPVKLKAKGHLAAGEPHLARTLYLQAASLELEALVLLDMPGESTVKSALVEILVLLKEGTGYRQLPDVPGGRRTVRSVQ